MKFQTFQKFQNGQPSGRSTLCPVLEYLSPKKDPLNPQKRVDAHFEEFSRMLFHARRRELSRSRGKPSERKAPDRLSGFNGGVLLPSGRWIGRAAKNEFLLILSPSAFRQTKSAPSMNAHGRGCVISRENSQRISMPSLNLRLPRIFLTRRSTSAGSRALFSGAKCRVKAMLFLPAPMASLR